MSLESVKWKKSEPLSDMYWSSDVPVVPPKCTCSEVHTVKNEQIYFNDTTQISYSGKQQVTDNLQSNYP